MPDNCEPKADPIDELYDRFMACSKILNAIGDETRQYLILKMMKMGDCNGVRVGAIAQTTNLSRPAVSHHLQILKDAGIIKMRRQGTKNYYYFDKSSSALEQLIETLQMAADISRSLHGGEDNITEADIDGNN